ncbi:inositol phosphorylceramide glucuronosyltransferase 1-like [Zerene cesonia]|uniref:inositol phosphorylceramide glucuronosyltransferase 1-like n=1 Tax=Zerene cesonia TaxID=33412 RepID=UPI0018E529D5|nr:inositol phosphorylceramide glucuronosyltransferase 1-like [Zerene cesonia]
MKFMDKLPTVISCCFCCFLRAGTVMIALVSFLTGLLFAPNVNHTRGFWDMDPVLSYYSAATENALQVVLGAVSVLLCFVSVLLAIGALCNLPALIEIYQWGVLFYGCTVFLLFTILDIFCFFVHTNCAVAGAVLLGLMVVIVLLTMYFIIVVNSLRMSMKYLNNDEFVL